jgi:hypothetical protein
MMDERHVIAREYEGYAMRIGSIRRPALCAVLVLAAWILGPAVASAEPRCLCRYAGQYYAEGECVCMTLSSGARFACCGRVLNNSSWTFVADGCQVATGAVAPRPQLASAPDDAPGRGLSAEPPIR